MAAAAGRATTVIFSGIAVASVLGVPAGTFLGELAGWRWAFAVMGVFALTVSGLLAVVLPPLPASAAVRLRTFPGLLRNARLRAGLLVVLLLVTGHSAAYTYVRPVLERVPGLGAGLISGLLLAYGVAGIIGTFPGGEQHRPTAEYHGRRDVTFVPVDGVPDSVLWMVWRRDTETERVRAFARAVGAIA